jgi:glyoxylase-like metal-dependent hydrolase (beta-lactamase superfamily II)
MREAIRVGNVDVAVARDSYWGAAPATHLRDRNQQEIPLEQFKPFMGRRDPNVQIASRVLCFVVKSRGKTILLDAGVGTWGFWRFGDGHLFDALAGLDVRREEIDYVIPSHLHADHIGGNTYPDKDGQPIISFPNAQYLFHKADWDHFTDSAIQPAARNNVAEKCLLPIAAAGNMDLVTTELDVTDELKLLHTPGHTVGSMSAMIHSGGEAAIFVGDIAHLCMQLTEWDWSPNYEMDREASARSRQRLVEEAVARNALVSGPHLDEGPIFGSMMLVNGRRVWTGVDVVAQRDTSLAAV